MSAHHTPIRVLSVPAGHAYVRHALAGATGVAVLDDPTSPWWPPLALDPGWLGDHRHTFDVAHVHFGFEQIPLDQLMAWCNATRELDVPVVVTVHDLRNPHLQDNAPHERRLALLLERADAVVTLTAGAAAEIARRYGRRAVVIPHPHLLPLGHRVPASRRATAAMYFGAGRANVIRPNRIVPDVATACSERRVALRVRVHAHARPDLRNELEQLRSSSSFDLRVTPPVDDETLFAELGSLQLVVLPYRFGTHSGWVELCRDLGTQVVAPACGHFRDQWSEVRSFAISADGTGPSPGAVGAAVVAALEAPPLLPAEDGWRSAQRDEIGALHRVVYASAMRRPAAAAR